MGDKSSNAPGGAQKGDQIQRKRLREMGSLQACRTASVGSVGRAVCVWPRAWWWSCCADVRQFTFAYDVLEAHGHGYRFRVGLVVHRLVLAVMVAVSAARWYGRERTTLRCWGARLRDVSGAVCVVVWCYTQGPADSCGGEWGSLMDEGRRRRLPCGDV
jgi:hypothetical protein